MYIVDDYSDGSITIYQEIIMLKKSIASLVLSMGMLASGSVFAFSDTGVKNHADGKDCPGFYQSDSFSTYSGGWTQTNSTDK